MKGEELDRLADAIARALIEARQPPAAAPRKTRSEGTWLPTPVRPEPPSRGADPAPWTGAAQRLHDIAPGGAGEPTAHRATTAELTTATRAAAAGKGAPREDRRTTARTARIPRRRGDREGSIEVTVGVSNRHIHLSSEHVRALYGADALTVERQLSQPGQFAARERVNVIGPAGTLAGVRVVGPPRGRTQLELAPSDCRIIGVLPPIRPSGLLEGSVGGVTLEGPAGSVPLEGGVIIAARHLHLSAEDASRWGLRDGDLLDVRCGTGARATTLHDVLVRAGPEYATELHLDSDEAYAAGVHSGDSAMVLAWRSQAAVRRPLVTERDVLARARAGLELPDGAILTPSARDRARSIGLLRE